MNKRTYLLLLFAGLINSGILEAQWKTEKCPTMNNLNCISFTDRNSGWIVGNNGTIIKKSKSGWEEYQKITSENLNSIFMVDEKNGWAVGNKGVIIYYDGYKWKPFESPTNYNLNSVSFSDSENGFAVGDFGTILTFKNGVWSLKESGSHGRFLTVSCENDNAWIGGGLEFVNVPILKLGINKNESTLTSTFDSYGSINSIIFLNSENAWAVGDPSTILHFDGQKWERSGLIKNFSSLKSVYFSDENHGISVGYFGTILIYNDGQWMRENSTTVQDLKCVTRVGDSYYAIGNNGTIVTKKSEGTISEPVLIEEKTEKIIIFPNPCDKVLNVFIAQGNENTTSLISISNVNGQVLLIKKLFNQTGNLNYSIDTSELSNNIYFLQIKTGIKITTLKFVIKH